MEIILPIGAGLCVGFLIGLTGMGGGALMTPFLLIFMNVNPVLAVGTDLTFAAITKIVSGIQHRREKNVSLRAVFWMAAGSLPSSFLGAQFILKHSENVFLVEEFLPRFLGGVLIVVSLILFARVFRWLGPKEMVDVKWPKPWALIVIGAIGGALVGMTSIGGGTVIMALLLIFFSIPLNVMVGMDVVHGALLASLSASNYILAGKIDIRLVILLLVGSLPGAWLGTILVKRIAMRVVRGLLALLILGAGVNLMFY